MTTTTKTVARRGNIETTTKTTITNKPIKNHGDGGDDDDGDSDGGELGQGGGRVGPADDEEMEDDAAMNERLVRETEKARKNLIAANINYVELLEYRREKQEREEAEAATLTVP